MSADSVSKSESANGWRGLKAKIAAYGRLIRFSHTIFALPFALASLALASATQRITSRSVMWILVAMVGARSAAMGFNRIVDRKFDALNPRTQNWELPRGLVKLGEAIALTLGAAVIFIYAAFQLNFFCFVLSPIALAIICFYSVTKRFTWASHPRSCVVDCSDRSVARGSRVADRFGRIEDSSVPRACCRVLARRL